MREIKQNAMVIHWRGINSAWGIWENLMEEGGFYVVILNLGRISNRFRCRAEIIFYLIFMSAEPNSISNTGCID